MVDVHCSSPKPINIGVSQGYVLSSTLFLLFISDLLNLTQCPIHSYADDYTLYFTSFSRRQNQKQVNDSREDATERLAFDFSLVSDSGRENLVLFNATKTRFFHLSTRQNLPDNYTLYFDDTHLSSSSTLNILGLSTKTLNWKSHSSLAKSASKKLGVLYRLHQLFLPLLVVDSLQGPYPSLYGVRISRIGGSTHTELLKSLSSY